MAPSVPLDYTERRDLKTSSHSRAVTMGKAKKFSKGHSAGFVPDYRHAVETTADSEVFGSSGRGGVETGMAVSADLFAAKRKSISLNADTYERYGVPLQVFSLSRMSRPQRRDLELRFKNELQQVRRFQKEIDSFNSNAMVSSYIRTCSDEPKRQPVESYPRSMDLSQGKKRAPPGRNGPRTKGSSAGRVDLVKHGPPTTSNFAMLMKKCETLLSALMAHQYGWVFNTPVDVVKLNIPDYFNVIKHPMDLGTVKNKLLSGGYSSPQEFAADVRLTFSNAMTYNPRGNDVHIMADALSKVFENRWKQIEKKVPVVIDTPVLSTSSVHIETETPRQTSPPKKKRFKSVDNKIKQEPPMKRVMTVSDKQKLSDELDALVSDETSDLPYSIVDLLKKQTNGSNDAEEEEIEIDIYELDNDTLFTLRKLLDDYFLDKQRKQCGDEAREMKLLNNPGVSNSSTHPPEGNDPLDEDVDIGGNDPPLSSCPPVEIEKDMPPRNSKCSSSSSSSSDSGSSSSDSDSGSSGSDSDGGGAPAASTKENMGSGENVGQPRNDLDNATLGEDLAGVNPIEQNFQSNNDLGVDIEACQEGESAPTGRQVSPDKLYRAALLRSRFADTILKAQEKNLDKGEKIDPEKLRLEREELERRRKEEKARLQAEARAAEEARRKAEADAIAEAKRQRELKREAERQALQKMEKTVEINENCQFMEDLEMLRAAAPGEQVESCYADVASPVVSETGLGGFNFQGNSNALEQLGLFMKVDEEEEDEAPPPLPSGGDAADGGSDGDEDVDIDVEEGEI